MESELNKKIRELLEKFGIKTDKVIGDWNIIGHFVNLIETENHLQQQRVRDIVEILRKKEFRKNATDGVKAWVENEKFQDGYQYALADLLNKLFGGEGVKK